MSDPSTSRPPPSKANPHDKPCTLCSTPRPVLVRCQIDDTGKWHFVCPGKCWRSVSGGVIDAKGHKDEFPHYRYGGMWKNRYEDGPRSARMKKGKKGKKGKRGKGEEGREEDGGQHEGDAGDDGDVGEGMGEEVEGDGSTGSSSGEDGGGVGVEDGARERIGTS